MSRSFAAAVAVFAFTGCATTPASSPEPARDPLPATVTETETSGFIRLSDEPSATIVVDAPVERVWPLMRAVYDSLRITVEVDDPTTRTIGTRRFTSARVAGGRVDEFVRCANEGAGPSFGGSYRTNISILSSVRSTPENRTLLSTAVGGTARAAEGTSTGPIRCVSNGLLEQRIRLLLLERLKTQARP